MRNVAILGLGLMGGSLGAALKARDYAGRITAFARREITRRYALEHGCVDEALAAPGEAVADADIVVCCVPILTIPDLVEVCRPHLKPGCVVTDVGSTKQVLVDRAAEILRGSDVEFVGSHPIAGSERQGIDAGSADLYEGAAVIVTPGHEQTAGVEAVCELWNLLGARTVVMDPSLHDRLLARTSHLPHLVASALARTVGRDGDPGQTGLFCGTGFRDTTRVAEGSPEVWLDIVKTNRSELVREMKAFLAEMGPLLQSLEAENFEAVHKFLDEGKTLRKALVQILEDDE